jgi:hypothetical protein
MAHCVCKPTVIETAIDIFKRARKLNPSPPEDNLPCLSISLKRYVIIDIQNFWLCLACLAPNTCIPQTTSDMTPTESIPIYTLGYGHRAIEDFIALLQSYQIAYVVDVRSAPYSRFKPEFSKDTLERALKEGGLRYLYLGNILGGRPDDTSCYIDGKVDYEAIKTKDWYQEGIERIKTAFEQQHRVALMCSEGKPEQCHRTKLLAVSLIEAGVKVVHIDETDTLKSQEDILTELTGGQLHLFGETPFTSRKRYPPNTLTGSDPQTNWETDPDNPHTE